MAGTAEDGDLALDGIAAQAHGDAVRRGLTGRKPRENGDAQTGGDEGSDGFQFAALTRDARLETGSTARGQGGIAGAALVEDK